MSDWKCDICGRKTDGTDQPPQGWLLLVIQDRYTSLNEERVLCKLCLDVIRQAERDASVSDADKPSSLPQLKEMAEVVARAVADEADFNEWSRLWYTDDDDEVDSYSREKVVRQIAIRAKPVLAPLYAELNHAKAENGQLRAANARLCAETIEKDATIDRLTKLLGEVRPYVKHDRLCVLEQHDAEDFSICKCGLKTLLTRLDAEIGGK